MKGLGRMWRSYRPAVALAGASLLACGLLASSTAVAAAAGAPAVARIAGSPGPGAVRVVPGWWGGPEQPGNLRTAVPGGRPGTTPLPGARLVPQPGASSELEGVFCRASNDCWAVGDYRAASGAQLNQALHWTGSKWSQVTTPNPGGTASTSSSRLFGVRCKAANDCWAVGEYLKSGAFLNEALHWNGSKWSMVPTPMPGGNVSGDLNELFDVVCPATTDCWAAGQYGSNGGTLNQVLHWNGTKWSKVTAPNPGGTGSSDINVLDSVRCTASSNCWTVGEAGTFGTSFLVFNEALHWNGTNWSQVTTPNPGGTATGDFSDLTAVSCTSATNCWADGSYGSQGSTGNTLNQALHWDGGNWTLAPTPDPDGTGEGASNGLVGLSCTSAANCWAVGQYGSISGGVGVVLNEALHWNGTAWSQKPTPNPAGTADTDFNSLIWVHCNAANNCWAVGDTQKQQPSGPFLNQALHWNGTKWSIG